VLFTLIGMAGMYFVLGLLYLYLIGREVAYGPDHHLSPSPYDDSAEAKVTIG
jgi:cytochrome bd-type quinol oxidase subunit 1